MDFNYVPNGQTGVSPRVDSEKLEKLIEISKGERVSPCRPSEEVMESLFGENYKEENK